MLKFIIMDNDDIKSIADDNRNIIDIIKDNMVRERQWNDETIKRRNRLFKR